MQDKIDFTLAEVLATKRVSEVRGLPKQKFAHSAFTLAEVLITLAIIGVVAALTIPTVINNYQEKQTVVRVKKAYTTFNQAIQMSVAENGPIETWGWGTSENDAVRTVAVLNKYIAPYLKITKNCGINHGCFKDVMYKNFSGSDWATLDELSIYAKARLADGSSIFLHSLSANCSFNISNTNTKPLNQICGGFGVDINGDAGPNVLGKDIYWFMITKLNNVMPLGMPDDSLRGKLSDYCSKTATNMWAGHGCAYWIIAHENMDYLKKTFTCTGGTTVP